MGTVAGSHRASVILSGDDPYWSPAATGVWCFRLQIAQLSFASCEPCQPDPNAVALTSRTSSAAHSLDLSMIDRWWLIRLTADGYYVKRIGA